MELEPFLPFEYDGWDPAGEETSTYYKCEMTRDLGPLKAGDTCEYITVDLQAGTFDFLRKETDEEVHRFYVALKAVEPVQSSERPS